MRRVLAILLLCVAAASCDSDSPTGPAPTPTPSPSATPSPTPPGARCGVALCPAGSVCCNASCGICVPPGGACTLMFCGQSPCARDEDCRTFSFACEDCACWALHVGDAEPSCPRTPVSCLVDPCLGRSAVCDPAARTCALR